LPAIFFDNFDFEKYAEFAINFKILFIEHEGKYISGQKYTFKDFMEGKISEIGNRLPTESDLTTHLKYNFHRK
jgi:glutamate--cysteine ligase